GLGVGPVLARLALAGVRQQAELLVVANRARRRPGQPRELADPQRVGRRAHAFFGRIRDTMAPTTDVAGSTHRAGGVLWMNGWSLASESPVATPEKIANSVSFGTEEVTIASTNAIETTAPVFCSIVRAPAAIPRRCCGTVPIMAAVLGLLNMPDE